MSVSSKTEFPRGPVVWGDVDVTWHYRQTSVDTAGPAKDRSQKRWGGACAFGLSGLHVRQLSSLGFAPIHGLTINRSQILDLEHNHALPIFGYNVDKLKRTTDKRETRDVFRIREAYGWTGCTWSLYRETIAAQVEEISQKIGQGHPKVLLLNDAGWGAFRDYFFGSKASTCGSLREWLAAKLRTDLTGYSICLKSRIYPPIEYQENGGDSSLQKTDPKRNCFLPFIDRAQRFKGNQTTPINLDPLLLVSLGINDLRILGLNVSRGISWERTIQHLLEAAYNDFAETPHIPGIREAKFVLVSFGCDGLILLERIAAQGPIEKDVKATLFFHGPSIEGDSERRIQGRAYGATTWVSTFLAGCLCEKPEGLKDIGWLNDLLCFCLAYTRVLTIDGNYLFIEETDGSFGQEGASDKPQMADWPREAATPSDRRYPGQYKSEAQRKTLVNQQRLRSITVSRNEIWHRRRNEKGLDEFSQKWWSFLALTHEIGLTGSEEENAEEATKRAVRYAFDVLRYGGWGAKEFYPHRHAIPYAKFDNLVTSDRAEIESLRNLSSAIEEYLKRKENKPLNIAVFGPPGAGKSFGVTSVVKSIQSEKQPKFLTFNLSQFQSADQLPVCYQQIQNVVLKGELPVVFWDEFDTTLDEVNFGWLHSFLAPMQDGTFVHGQRENEIGQCIFVFAGSRFDRFSDLPEPSDSLERPRAEVITMSFRELEERSRIGDLETTRQERERAKVLNLRRNQEDWRLAKGNDFRSRLRAYLDVQDCNLRTFDENGAPLRFQPKEASTTDQLNFLVKRARMVRQKLLSDLGELFVDTKYGDNPEVSGTTGLWIPDDKGRSYQELKIGEEIAFGFLSPYPFIHGMRSIESILKTSELSGKTRFERAFIPASEILKIHVNPRAFDKPAKDEVSTSLVNSYLDSWLNQYRLLLTNPTKLLAPRVEVETAIVGGQTYACLSYRKDVSQAELGDRLEILISLTTNNLRPELWHTIAYDRGSPYLLNAELYMFEVLNLPISDGNIRDVYISCRWWNGSENGPLSKPLSFRLTSDGNGPRLDYVP